MQDLSGTLIYPHKNQVGTTMRHTDASETVVNTYEYDAWGQPLVATESNGQQYRFTGKELDPDFVDYNSVNRRYHFPARFYIPFRAIFSQYDPFLFSEFYFTFVDGYMLSPYSYSRSGPTCNVDPYGLLSCQDKCEPENAIRNQMAHRVDLYPHRRKANPEAVEGMFTAYKWAQVVEIVASFGAGGVAKGVKLAERGAVAVAKAAKAAAEYLLTNPNAPNSGADTALDEFLKNIDANSWTWVEGITIWVLVKWECCLDEEWKNKEGWYRCDPKNLGAVGKNMAIAKNWGFRIEKQILSKAVPSCIVKAIAEKPFCKG